MRKNILIAEDNDALRNELAGMLRKNTEVFEAQDKEQALEILNSQDIDAVLTDLHMPYRGDGEVVAQTALEKKIRVVILSTVPESLDPAIKSKCAGVFKKGYCHLDEVIGAVLGK
ncbi:MAG: response regulator [Candidatus Peregrinibacteria bacterium]|nr:response regulator [Candidatus Peregrinibacteria bacterium]